MKPDDFEKRLQSQPLRQIPTEWRRQILQNARQSAPSALDPRPSLLSTLLWPNPKAWAGLAVVWVVVFVLQFASRETSRTVATVATSQSSAILASLKDQQKTLVELMGNDQPKDADQPPRGGPRPRSDLGSRAAII
jgi:hypothetical protein